MAVMPATKIESGQIGRAPSGGLMKLARSAGALYLINIIGGAFAISIVPALLFGSDPAATAHNIQAHELLYRSGLAAHVVVTVTNIFLALIFYEIFKVGSGPYANALPAAQLQALAYLPSALASVDYNIHTVFFGFDIILMAYLVLRSRFLPRAIALLLAIDGVAYLIYSFTAMLAPGFASQLVPWIQLPALFGEGSLCLWLLVAGVNVEQWKKWASAATRMRSSQMETL
jgi:hypothetical protein